MQKLTIQQASDWLSLPKSTLRFWEREFAGLIVPERTQGGQRRYGVKDMAIFEAISELKKRGLSLTQIKDHLQNSAPCGKGLDPLMIDALAERLTRLVRHEISNLLVNEGVHSGSSANGSEKKSD